MDAHPARFEPALQFGDGGARIVESEQFVRVVVEAGGGSAAATPGPGIGLQARSLGGCVEGRSVARAGQEAGYPAGGGSGFPRMVGNNEGRMGAIIVQAEQKRK